MPVKLTDTVVKDLETPAKGNRIVYDSEVKGFGCRVTAKGARAFILNYRTQSGRERRFTIGSYPDWKTIPARDEAKALKRRIDVGEDPMEEREEDRQGKTMADLCERFEEEHLPKKRPATVRDYKSIMRREILPEMKHLKVAEVTYTEIDDLHRKITRRGAPYVANRTLSVLSKMFGLAQKWRWRIDNPCRGVERNSEEKRQRYLSPAELGNLTEALANLDDQQGANVIRLLLLTGARSGEVKAARWEDLDLEGGVWTKPGSTTKQKTTHRVPLSAPARQLLSELLAKAKAEAKAKDRQMSPYVFPGRSGGHREEVKRTWHDACVAAGIVTAERVTNANGKEKLILKPSARIHDLRHTYASLLASAGLSLPIIGALLGHSQPATTARYSHLMDDPLRAATERVGAIVAPAREEAEVIPIKGGA